MTRFSALLRFSLLLLLGLGIALPSMAQQPTSISVKSVKHATINLATAKPAKESRRDKDSEEEKEEGDRDHEFSKKDAAYRKLQDLKRERTAAMKPISGAQRGARNSGVMPTLSGSFSTNFFEGGVPNDNSLAISNGGLIITVANSNMVVYDTAGSSLLPTVKLQTLFAPLGIPGSKYDPRTLYDFEKDRFIVLCLNGSADSTSHILFAFSKTNDPRAGWNLYAIPGDPLKNKTWSDFPNVSLTKGGLMLTLNAILNDTTWQAGFKESYFWYLNTDEGFAGTPAISSELYRGFNYNGRPIRNLCTVQQELSLSRDTVYMISNRNFDATNDTFFIIRCLNPGKSNVQFTTTAIRADNPYGAPPNARQPIPNVPRPKRKYLATNDARPLHAIILGDRIRIVGNTIDFKTGKPSFYFGDISSPATAPQISTHVYSHAYMDLGYPSIAFSGKRPDEDEFIININFAGDTTYAGCGSIFYSNRVYSDVQRSISSNYILSVIPDSIQRWGDYSGIQRRHNRLGQVWLVGTYVGKRGPEVGYASRVSQVYGPNYSPAHVFTAKNPTISRFNIYPNPAISGEVFRFEAPASGNFTLNISDASGRLIEKKSMKLAKGETYRYGTSRKLSLGTYHLTLVGEGAEYYCPLVVNMN